MKENNTHHDVYDVSFPYECDGVFIGSRLVGGLRWLLLLLRTYQRSDAGEVHRVWDHFWVRDGTINKKHESLSLIPDLLLGLLACLLGMSCWLFTDMKEKGVKSGVKGKGGVALMCCAVLYQ